MSLSKCLGQPEIKELRKTIHLEDPNEHARRIKYLAFKPTAESHVEEGMYKYYN